MKKIMNIDDLVKFCEEQNFAEFDAQKSGYQLFVSTPAEFEKDDNDDDSMLFANIKAFHTGLNRNKSNVTEKAAKGCLSSIKYKPILCNYQTVTLDDGTEVLDFTSHDMDIDEDGNITYLEKQVGCFTADKPTLEYDKEKDRYYVYAKAAIPREYTPAAEIIERKGGTDVSVELYVNKMSYDAKKKELLLEDIEVSGLTLLGSDKTPGMEGAKLQIEDFSAENTKIDYEANKALIEVLDKLNNTLANFNINAERKEENPMNKFNELLEKYGKTAEEITFEYEGLSDEELETAFKKAFDDVDPAEPTDPAQPADPADPEEGDNSEDTTDQDAADAVATIISALPETPDANDQVAVQAARDAYNNLTDDQKELVDSEVVSALEDAEDAVATDKLAVAARDAKDEKTTKRKNNEISFSAVVNGEEKVFSISLADKLSALRDLVNNTYSESDNAWYDVDAYDEEKYVVMHDWWNNKHFRQEYNVKKDVYSLKGDRVEVFAQYLTSDEISKLDAMKANYEAVNNSLMQYQKKELAASEDYSAIAGKDEFVQIVSDVNDGKNEMTFEELKKTFDGMLLNYAKKGQLNFEAVEAKAEDAKKKEIKRVGLMSSGVKGNIKKSRYGNLFSK